MTIQKRGSLTIGLLLLSASVLIAGLAQAQPSFVPGPAPESNWGAAPNDTAAPVKKNNLVLAAKPGELTASNADGMVVWKVRRPGSAAPSWKRLDNGLIVLDDGMVLDKCGRALTRLHKQPGGDTNQAGDPGDNSGGRGGKRGDPYWSALAELGPGENPKEVLFDSQGNAWAFFNWGGTVQRSNGHDGTWQPPETIWGSTAVPVIDADDNITLLFKFIRGRSYGLGARRYEPGTGWSGITDIYCSSSFFQNITAGVDLNGNVVAVIDEVGLSFVYDAASGTWGPPQSGLPPGGSFGSALHTVANNRSRTAIYLAYLATRDYDWEPHALYVHRFDSDSKQWLPRQMVPGSWGISAGCYGPGCNLRVAVDDFGEVTVFWRRIGRSVGSGLQQVCAARTQNGVWQLPHAFQATCSCGNMESFADIDVNEFGDVLCVFAEAGSFHALRYRAGVGWEEENPYDVYWPYSTRSRVCFYQGAHAAATFYGVAGGDDQLLSILYDGTTWENELLDIPEGWPTFYQAIAADQGEPVLIFEGAELYGGSHGTWATWLRDAAP